MRKLILVRHSLPVVTGNQTPSHWQLSPEGRHRCGRLAELLADYHPSVIVTSTEPKAIETGQIVGERLGVPVGITANLHEHERPGTDLGTLEQFQAKVARLFEHPGELIFGAETGDEACERFSAAIDGVMNGHPAGNVAIVSHGTVMTLFLANATGIDPIPFWKDLGLPAFVALSYPELSLLDVVASVV